MGSTRQFSYRELLRTPLLGGSRIGTGAGVIAPASSLMFDALSLLGLQAGAVSPHISTGPLHVPWAFLKHGSWVPCANRPRQGGRKDGKEAGGSSMTYLQKAWGASRSCDESTEDGSQSWLL